jgi:hypothetical protein
VVSKGEIFVDIKPKYLQLVLYLKSIAIWEVDLKTCTCSYQ